MARKKKSEAEEAGEGEQLQLIEVGPENEDEIKVLARKYKSASKRRIKALADEVAAKTEIIGAVKAAKLKPLDDGSIRFRCDGMIITITPRDELVKVKEEEEE